MNDPERGRQDALSGEQPRSHDYGYQAAYQQEAERQRIQAGWAKLNQPRQAESYSQPYSGSSTGGGSLASNFVLLESLLVGGLTALVLWQLHPVLGILGFFAGMFGFIFLFAIPVVKHVLGLAISAWYALIGWNYASRHRLDIIWHVFIAASIFGVSYLMHRKVAGKTSLRRAKRTSA